MRISGCNFIGGTESTSGTERFRAFSTRAGVALEPEFYEATEAEIDRAVTLATTAAPRLRAVSADVRAEFLDAVANDLVLMGDELISRASSETALSTERLTGERTRTVNQLRMFASVVRDGGWVDAVIDTALPERKPVPRTDLRRMLVPIGPVAIFGASNFPLAFSTPGGDVASALAAGCPVIVKAHPAHPGTSELVARAILQAVSEAGLPDGTFSMLHGGPSVGLGLIRHPNLEAAAFTGSLAAGRALCDAAAARPRPIPMFAEMGSINPVFLLPRALRESRDQIASGLAQSFTLGVGQFCTKPGLVVAIDGPGLVAFVDSLVAQTPDATSSMLTEGIGRAFQEGTARVAGTKGVRALVDARSNCVVPTVFQTDAETFLRNESLSEEVFGPMTMIVACADVDEMSRVAAGLDGQLTATVHGTPDDLQEHSTLLAILERKAGRLVFNGFPTGVEVCAAMQHGGPYPASSDGRFTSVGTSAIARFARPVCWQSAPDSVLPPELRNANPLGIRRLVDNRFSLEPIG